jgi:L-proline amide hydrolase
VEATFLGTSLHILTNFSAWDMSQECKHIKVPTLVVHGEFDEAQPVVVAPWLKGIPNVKEAIIRNGSHTAHLELPVEYIRVVSNFLG